LVSIAIFFIIKQILFPKTNLVEELYIAATKAKVVIFGEESGNFFIIGFVGHDIPNN